MVFPHTVIDRPHAMLEQLGMVVLQTHDPFWHSSPVPQVAAHVTMSPQLFFT
jgi:hypothetical protein